MELAVATVDTATKGTNAAGLSLAHPKTLNVATLTDIARQASIVLFSTVSMAAART